jgi:hypothetical protein
MAPETLHIGCEDCDETSAVRAIQTGRHEVKSTLVT